MQRTKTTLLALLALGALQVAPAAAQLDCSAVTPGLCSGSLATGAPLAEAEACLCRATPFFEDVRTQITDKNFSQILPTVYEATEPSRYSDALLEQVLAWAEDGAPSPEKNAVLYEAALRQASAHGMFGDERLVSGLNASFDPLLVDPIREGLGRLDSRVCTVNPQTLCTVDADCPAADTCTARRVEGGPDAAFGAVQEYRRAERSLARVVERVGADGFQELDEAAGPCGSVGCATRLLFRLGAMKARAQQERADRLWQLATAAGGPMADAPVCVVGSGAGGGEACQLHADCDAIPGVGRCGASAAEQRIVAFREAVSEALAEGAVLQSLYTRLAASTDESPDLRQMAFALADLTDIEARAVKGDNPFGLPPNYVPLLSSVQEGVIGCSEECPTGNCDLASFFDCLLTLADGNGQLGVLTTAEDQQAAAELAANDFADAVRDAALFESETKGELRDVIVRMFGQPCVDCACAVATLTEEQRVGSCFEFDGEVWQVAGTACEEESNPFGGCTTEFVDGEVERQIQAVRNAQLALDNLDAALDRNSRSRRQAYAKFEEIERINGRACTGIEGAIEAAADSTSAVLEGEKISTGEVTGNAFLEGFGGAASGALVGATIGGKAGPAGIAAGFLIGGVIGGVNSGRNDAKANHAIDVEQTLRNIERDRELEVLRVKCLQESRLVDVEQADALFQIATERMQLRHQALEQRGVILDAQVGANQLLSELVAAEGRFEEAQELASVWGGSGVRNPQNYRPVVLKKQIDAGQTFRSAQILTWLILRAAAYDLARPDFLAPQRFEPSDVIELGPNQCQQSECVDDGTGVATGNSCVVDSDCGAAQSCQLQSTSAGMADSDGSCSLQAVFAARTVDDLRHLIRSAFLTEAATFRTLASCGQGNCQKTVRLRDLFTDPTLGAGRPTLGSIMKGEGLPEVEFEITLKRRFELCEDLPAPLFEEFCAPNGVASLRNDGTGSGENLADNVYNARFLQIGGVVRYDPSADPTAMLCRDGLSGEPVSPSPCASSGECPTCDLDLFGNAIPCVCRTIFDGDPVAELVQLGPGVVRSDQAQRISSLDDDCVGTECPTDSFLRYEVRSGNLPITGEAPSFDFFRVLDLLLFQDTGTALASMNPNVKGVPVASPRWRLRIDTEGLADERFQDAYLDSIEDIELILDYQGFNVPAGN